MTEFSECFDILFEGELRLGAVAYSGGGAYRNYSIEVLRPRAMSLVN